MKITGDVSNIELDSIKFTDLKGVERRCQESLEEFEVGDKIISIALGEVKEDNIELSDGIYFVKTKVAGDFLTRFIDSLNKSVQEIDKPAEIH